MRVDRFVVVLILTLFLTSSGWAEGPDGDPTPEGSTETSEAAPPSTSRWKRLWRGVTDGTAACANGLNQAWAKTQEAAEAAQSILESFKKFLERVSTDGVATVQGGASGLRTVLIGKVLKDAPFMAWRVWMFEANTEGLRDGIFGPMTQWTERLIAATEAEEELTTKDYVQKQTELYGELVVLFFETALKMQKLVPQQSIRLIPTALGTVLPVVKSKNPKYLDELTFMVLKSFMVGTWKAITTRGVTMNQRFAMLAWDGAVIDGSSQFLQEAGVVAFRDALARYRALLGPAAALPAPEVDMESEEIPE